MRYAGRSQSRWNGVLPLALALYAMTPDFIYGFNPFHRDWMDVFLFHVALDEILPFALIVLAGYIWFPVRISRLKIAPEETVRGSSSEPTGEPLSVRQRTRLGFLLVASVITLAVLATSGVVTERSAHTPLIQVGQRAPGVALPSTSGSTASLAKVRGHPVLLAFVPSVLCDFCREQLRTFRRSSPSCMLVGSSFSPYRQIPQPFSRRLRGISASTTRFCRNGNETDHHARSGRRWRGYPQVECPCRYRARRGEHSLEPVLPIG